MQFSGLELSAIVKMAVAVAASDGEVAETEKAAIALDLMKFGVGVDDVQGILGAAQAIEFKDALTVISLMNNTQKKYVASFLALVIAADKKILDSEIKVWSLISALCDLPSMTIAEGLEFWKNN